MDEFTNYNEQNLNDQTTNETIDSAQYFYQQNSGEQTTVAQPPKKKKSKVAAIIWLVIGILLAIAGMVVVFAAENFSSMEDEAPIDVYYAEETDKYCYALIQYMTEPIASYEVMEKMQFYIVFDKEWNPAIVCVHDDEIDAYMTYIEWLYSESYENEPVQMEVRGYAQPIEEELAQYAIEGYNALWGDEILDETNYTDWFGSYFLQIGQKNDAYDISKTGVYILVAAVICLVIGSVLLYQRREIVEAAGPIIQESHLILGILGAVFGALLGGLLWAVAAAIGYYFAALGILIVVFSYSGYSMFEHNKKVFGSILSFLLSLVMVVAASYVGCAWEYYCSINESINGYISMWHAMKDLYPFMVQNDLIRGFVMDLGLAVIFVIIAFCSSIGSNLKAGKK